MSRPDEIEAHFATLKTFFLEKIPFNRVLGIEIVELSPGRVVLSIPFRDSLIGDPVRPALHGGVISALADTCGGCAVWSVLSDEDRVSTIDLRVDYLRPGRLEALRQHPLINARVLLTFVPRRHSLLAFLGYSRQRFWPGEPLHVVLRSATRFRAGDQHELAAHLR